jgi:hypothetical protein
MLFLIGGLAAGPDDWRYNYDKIPIERMLLEEPAFRTAVLRLPAVYGPRDYQLRVWEYLRKMDAQRKLLLRVAPYPPDEVLCRFEGSLLHLVARRLRRRRSSGRLRTRGKRGHPCELRDRPARVSFTQQNRSEHLRTCAKYRRKNPTK